MPGFPMIVSESGRLVDMKIYALTDAPVQVSPTSYPTMTVSIQNQSGDGSIALVGDSKSQSRQVADGATYNVNAGDANNVWMRAQTNGAATVNVHLLVPAKSR